MFLEDDIVKYRDLEFRIIHVDSYGYHVKSTMNGVLTFIPNSKSQYMKKINKETKEIKMHYYVVKYNGKYYDQNRMFSHWTPHLESATRFVDIKHTKLLGFPVTRSMIKEIKLTEGYI